MVSGGFWASVVQGLLAYLMDEMFPSHGSRDNLSEFFVMDVILNRRIVPPRNNNDAQPDPDLLSWSMHMVMEILWMTWTSNITHCLPYSPVVESFAVRVSDVGQRWVATRPTYSLMQVLGFGFERMLWWLPTTNDFHLVSADM
jgi:hypothetical protein